MPYDIGCTLKKCRSESDITVREISNILTKRGFKASQSTIYSWENGNSQPTPGALLVMCEVYGIKDILTTFGYNNYNEDGSLQLNINETNMIEKYRQLDTYGTEMVDIVLDKEYERCQAPQEQATIHNPEATESQQPTRIINYYYRLASAGTHQIPFDMSPRKRIEIPDKDEYRKVDYAIGVHGSSMEPMYYDNDTLLVEMTEGIEVGEIGIFAVDGEKQIIFPETD